MKINIIDFANNLYEKLKSSGISFNYKGYPIFPERFLLTKTPDEVLPYNHRNAAKNKAKTVICFYEEDEELYRHMNNLDVVATECSKYMGIVGFDLSPCIYWDIKQQKFNILLSQLITLYIAIQGNKIIPNFRIGSLETIEALNSYSTNSIFCVGSLGCSRKVSEFNITQFKSKVFYIRPKKLLYYGKVLSQYKEFLKDIDVPYKAYVDFRTESYLQKENNDNE